MQTLKCLLKDTCALQILLSSCMTRMNTRYVKMALILYLSGVRNTKYGNQVLSSNCVKRGSDGGIRKRFFTRGQQAWPEATRAQEALGHCFPSDTGGSEGLAWCCMQPGAGSQRSLWVSFNLKYSLCSLPAIHFCFD